MYSFKIISAIVKQILTTQCFLFSLAVGDSFMCTARSLSLRIMPVRVNASEICWEIVERFSHRNHATQSNIIYILCGMLRLFQKRDKLWTAV
jgi:hypothetical protein